MPDFDHAASTPSPVADVAALYRQWAAAPLLYSRWLMALLDGQTAWCKAAEGWLASLPIFDPRVAMVRLWLDGLRHDAAES